MSLRSSSLTFFLVFVVGCASDIATPDEIDEVGQDQGTTRIIWAAGDGSEVVVYTPRVGPLVEHRSVDSKCPTCGPVPDPWMDVSGPVPDPWTPPQR